MRMAEGKRNMEFRQMAPIDYNDPLNIHPNDRWCLYFYWLKLYVAMKMEEITKCQEEYQMFYETYEELRATEDVRIMQKHLVVGMTTTSAARLQGSLRALKSPIVIVEEAAEIMESQVVTSLTEHCGHLILIGDHQQLRPNTADYTMEKKYNLGISLFERLIRNDIPCNLLNVQHRMRPEIAKLISPNIYPNLENHESVYLFSTIRGVESPLYFITHTNPEERSMDESKSNLYEAKFLLHLAEYLLLNGYKSEDITILAAYSGQMFLMRKERNNFEISKDVRIAVLDNYQGEESKIILLSLVRNNNEGKIGFLSIENRVCVALSRAREGMYIMGNMDMLSSNSDLWKKIRSVLEEQNSLGTSLPLHCPNHFDKMTYITNIHDFSKVRYGGCDIRCDELLNCGHNCTLTCHNLDRKHTKYVCREKCTRVLCEREHVCPKLCYETCGQCMVLVPQKLNCGHEMKYACSEKIFRCVHPVAAELPCKHKIDDKPCYRNIEGYPCPFPCNARLDKCGHACVRLCHINDDPDHLQVKMYILGLHMFDHLAPSTGRPEGENRAELVQEIREVIAIDGDFTVRMLAEELNTNRETVRQILTIDLGKRKVCARFVPHQLTEDQQIAHVAHCRDIIQTVENDSDFLDSIITGDETWCFKYDPDTKRQSEQWKSKGEPKQQKMSFQKSKIKTMLTTFNDSKGVTFNDSKGISSRR